MSKSTSPGWNHFYSKVFTKQKLHGGPNSLAGSLTFGAPTNRGTIRAIPRPSCAASTAFSSSTTVDAGGSCQFIGSTRTRSTRFHKVICSQNCSDLRRRAGFEPVKGRDCLYSRSRIVTSVSIAGAKRIHFFCKSVQHSRRRLCRIPQQDIGIRDLAYAIRFVR